MQKDQSHTQQSSNCSDAVVSSSSYLLVAVNNNQLYYDDLSVSDAQAAAETDAECCAAVDVDKDGGIGFTKLSDEFLCYNTI